MRLEITADVGGPLARYLRDGRPSGTAHRQVFLALDDIRWRGGSVVIHRKGGRAEELPLLAVIFSLN